MKKSILLLTLSFIGSVLLFSSCGPKWEITNPYENVDWKNHQKYKANLHAHTSRSDGNHSPNDIVDRYHELGYKILAITDHNEVTYPWEGFSELNYSSSASDKLKSGQIDSSAIRYENRNPKELEMFDIQGNEISSAHHMGSYFNDYEQRPTDEHITIKEIGNKNGLIVLNHPGRYTNSKPEKYTLDWYLDIFGQYSHVTGMEVFNKGERYDDRKLWDDVLQKIMPQRSVWGYSNDDYHRDLLTLGRNWNTFILPELNEESIRQAMLEGRFLFTYAVNGHDGPKVPQIKTIQVNGKKGFIEIDATGQDSIRWISGGIVVGKGKIINLSEVPDLSTYVRAEIFGPESVTGTQAFGVKLAE